MRVTELKQIAFKSLDLSTKIEIKESGRPVPRIQIVQKIPASKTRAEYTLKFDTSMFDKVFWLCGCDERNSLFCFVCLLFGGDDRWTKEGICDLKHLQDIIKKHEKSAKHQHNVVSFLLLGKYNFSDCLNSAYRESARVHNELATKNRDVLSKIIDIIKLCGSCNLPLHGHGESTTATRSVFLELIEYSKNLDPLLYAHFENSEVFKGTSKTTHNELLDCMLQVCQEYIGNEIRQSSFLACMIDDTSNVSTLAQTVVVLRYELRGTVYERFWGFLNAENENSQCFSDCILEELQPLLQDSPEKLIAQTYDGAAVFQDRSGGVNVFVQDVYKNAHYIYCYSHQLNKLVEKASSHIPSVKIFFENIKGISVFFNSHDTIAALYRTCVGMTRQCETRLNFHTKSIQTVFQNRDLILECFENIHSGVPEIYNVKTMCQAAGFAKWLNDDTFNYWLNFFNTVMPHVDNLYVQLQKFKTDVVKIHEALHSFEYTLLYIRNSLPCSLEEIKEEPVAKRQKEFSSEDLNAAASEICNLILTQVKDRFDFKNHLFAEKLFLVENYEFYKTRLPVEDIDNFCDAFPMVDRDALKNELGIFYSRPELSNNVDTSGCLKTLNFLASFALDTTVFKEMTKALQILVTMPMITSESERCFSTLMLIKSYLRKTMGEDRLTALGMLSIEKNMVKEIPEFNRKVIDKFANDKIEFHYI